VPFAVHEQWAALVVRLLDAFLATSAQADAAHAEAALDNLPALPRQVLEGLESKVFDVVLISKPIAH
jgi:hypothetical protein